ncbi:nucleotidyl transferase AbiEii/AbiGii toxin family protein [Odoribacter sp. OttesenSCG-928-L07]|nr:nucleotidyl transferase AbiEii/AbiGii toxin family protein [Odoribacter sp. OttesenSCG-928-L07]MDL2239321.1 nucleotidyl transferase AbiEii/AbiGii toxin family protein [Bacteroidales bacterium OttesenSCG-928-L14]MDL2240366.1 nucleotidyl transferase AbiEii/AbiGii toxin family protein [Bacteroidales bacterium OttesenSCG-928-K22]
MKLHTNKQEFNELIQLTATHFKILPEFIEKDYWITLILNNLSQSEHKNSVVFKGGTSLTKGYRLINRFSEDIDIALLDEKLTGNALKTKIRKIEKAITADLTEIEEAGVTRKGSVYRKSLFQYPSDVNTHFVTNIKKRIIVEINSFANPYPFVKQEIISFITEFLTATNQTEAIQEYGLQQFELNILDKRRTMLEKLVSLIRFSFSENPTKELAKKIRHFYDLYYLTRDEECTEYLQSSDFQNDLSELLIHDQQEFEEPQGWQTKTAIESPLLSDFSNLWTNLRSTYQNELTPLAFSEIPNERLIEKSFMETIKMTVKY